MLFSEFLRFTVSHLIFELNLIKLFKVFFYSHSIPSRLILNLFDSSTDERFIKTNNEIKIALGFAKSRPAARSPRPTSRPAAQRSTTHSTARGPAARGPLYSPRPNFFSQRFIYLHVVSLVVDHHRQRNMDDGELPWSFQFLSKSFQSFAIFVILCLILFRGKRLYYVFLLQKLIAQRTFKLNDVSFQTSCLVVSFVKRTTRTMINESTQTYIL